MSERRKYRYIWVWKRCYCGCCAVLPFKRVRVHLNDPRRRIG